MTVQLCPGKLHVRECGDSSLGSSRLSPSGSTVEKRQLIHWGVGNGYLKMAFGGKNWGRSTGISDSVSWSFFAPSKTSTYSWHKQLLFLHIILGEFFRSRHSFNIVSAEILLLHAGPVKASLLKWFFKLYWGVLIAFCGFSKFCHVIWSAMCSFGSWDTFKNYLLLQ